MKQPLPLRIGLTGGIGSGKTTVSDLFRGLNVPVIDADVIAHDIVEKGKGAYNTIVKEFGDGILDIEGNINRDHLRKLIFENKDKKLLLESIIHPEVRNEISSRVSKVTEPYCIISIPLLVESGLQTAVDRILVIDVPVMIQKDRVRKRDRVDQESIEKIINSQASREERLKYADDVIKNDGDITSLTSVVEDLDIKYRDIAATNV